MSSMETVQVELQVGMIELSLAQLLTKDHRIIEFPSILLPDDVKSGSIVKLTCQRSLEAESSDAEKFKSVQQSILSQFTREPKAPQLRVHNNTQTSVVLEWDKIDVGSADLVSLALYKNGNQLGVIPNPEKRTSTKLSNLEIDKLYTFELVLRTSAGVYTSNTIKVHTHKMTDLSGLTVCIGSLEGSTISYDDLEAAVNRIGCRPIQSEVQLDTTHFICTEGEGKQFSKAQAFNIPIVRPEWLKACESERRLVEVRQYYLTADPRLLAPHRPRAGSSATAVTDATDINDTTSLKSGKSSIHNESTIPRISVSDASAVEPSAPQEGDNAPKSNNIEPDKPENDANDESKQDEEGAKSAQSDGPDSEQPGNEEPKEAEHVEETRPQALETSTPPETQEIHTGESQPHVETSTPEPLTQENPEPEPQPPVETSTPEPPAQEIAEPEPQPQVEMSTPPEAQEISTKTEPQPSLETATPPETQKIPQAGSVEISPDNELSQDAQSAELQQVELTEETQPEESTETPDRSVHNDSPKPKKKKKGKKK